MHSWKTAPSYLLQWWKNMSAFFFYSLAKKVDFLRETCIRSLNLCVPQESLHSLKKNSKDVLANASRGKNLREKVSWRMKKKTLQSDKTLNYILHSPRNVACAHKNLGGICERMFLEWPQNIWEKTKKALKSKKALKIHLLSPRNVAFERKWLKRFASNCKVSRGISRHLWKIAVLQRNAKCFERTKNALKSKKALNYSLRLLVVNSKKYCEQIQRFLVEECARESLTKDHKHLWENKKTLKSNKVLNYICIPQLNFAFAHK